MTVMERLASSIVVPVVVLNKVEDAVPTARAMAAGGVDTMEITFRTACAPEAIKAVADNCPEVLVGAGTIINVEQAKLAVEMGAKFIVSPGFSDEVVGWCVENGIPVAPGCVTPTEIMAALKHGLKMVKFFPANVYGGVCHEEFVCSLCGTEVLTYRRCQYRQYQRVCRCPLYPRGGRQLGLSRRRDRCRQLGKNYRPVFGGARRRQGRITGGKQHG